MLATKTKKAIKKTAANPYGLTAAQRRECRALAREICRIQEEVARDHAAWEARQAKQA